MRSPHRKLRIGDRVRFPNGERRPDLGTVSCCHIHRTWSRKHVRYRVHRLYIVVWDNSASDGTIDIDVVTSRGRTEQSLHDGIFVVPTGARRSLERTRKELEMARASWSHR